MGLCYILLRFTLILHIKIVSRSGFCLVFRHGLRGPKDDKGGRVIKFWDSHAHDKVLIFESWRIFIILSGRHTVFTVNY